MRRILRLIAITALSLSEVFAEAADVYYGVGASSTWTLDARNIAASSLDGCVVHDGGTLATDETWAAGKDHVVYGTVLVPDGVTLTVASGATVKFVAGGIRSEGLCIANGATFTDIDDGAGLAIPSYALRGNFETDAATRIRFAKNGDEFEASQESSAFDLNCRGELDLPEGAVIHFGGMLEADETWTAGGDHVVYGTVLVPDGMTLTVASGATVKFVAGGIRSDGLCIANGATFTDIDDGAGLAIPSYALRGNFETDAATRIRFAKNGDEFEASQESSAFDLNCRGELDVPEGAVVHFGGTLAVDETWAADSVHVVYGTLVVAEGVMLTIETGTVVKFIAGGLHVDGTCVANGVTFTDIGDGRVVTSVLLPSYRLTGNIEMDESTRVKYAKQGDAFAVHGDSGAFRLDISENDYRFAHEVEEIAYASFWSEGEGVKVTVTNPQGGTSVLVDEPGEAGGVVPWDVPRAPGLYRFAHESDGEVLEAGFVVLDGAVVHDGTLASDETWAKDVVHIIGGNTYVPAGVTLNIEAGAVVKFMDGKVLSMSGGGICNAGGVVFTSIADDSAGGDTLADGDTTVPAENSWTILGMVDDDFMTEYRYGTVSLRGAIVRDMTWRKEKTYVIDGTLTVEAGVLVTIPAGTIVKFTDGSSLAVESGGECIARGAIFTHIADDAVGGDTMGDGDATTPEYGKYKVDVNIVEDDATEYRYYVPTTLSATISIDTMLRGNRVYVASNDVTVANGATLTVGHGASIKFISGKSLRLQSGSHLIAKGTRSRPVVFTSIKDDLHGGDTNGDGDRSVAYPGDWGGVISNGGRLDAEYAQFLYGGGVNGNSYGARASCFMWDNASGVFDCCRFSCSPMDGCFAQNATFNNCIFDDNDRGLVSHTGTITANNCVAANNRIGFFSHCSPLVVRNSISSMNSDAAITGDGGSRETANCYFGDEPKFIDPDSGDFRIMADSPCVDAGDAAYAPARDYYGQPRQTIKGIEPTGIPDVNGVYADIGIYELPPRYAASDVDLEVVSVTAPETLVVGKPATFMWKVANRGSVDAVGEWIDRLDLVSGSGTVVPLGEFRHARKLAAGGEYVATREFVVPSAAEGSCTIRVTANSNRDLYEGSLTANNVGFSGDATVSVAVMDFAAGNVSNLVLLSGGQVSYQVSGLPTGGGSLIIHPPSGEQFGAYVAFGSVPSAYASASAYTVLPNGDVLVSIPPHSGEDSVYLMLESKGRAQGGMLDVTVGEDYPAIYALSKESMPNTGSQSLAISGVGMDEVASVALVATDGTAIDGSSIRAANACELLASFSLTGAKPGTYRVVLTAKDGATSVSSATISVVSYANAKANLVVSLDAPPAIRQNRWYEAVLTVKNTGDADSIIPVVVLNGENVEFRDPDGGVEVRKGVIQLLPINPDGDPLVIPPGDEVHVNIVYRFTLSTSRNELRYGLLDFYDAVWTSFISKGSLPDSEWEAALAEYSSGFDSPTAFLSTVYNRAAQFKTESFRPVNAFRMYGVVQAEKGTDRRSGIVKGVALDEVGEPICNLTIGVGNLDDNDTVYATTDANGRFVAYGVWPGEIAFTTDDYNVVPETDVDLACGGSATARLTCTRIDGDSADKSGYFKEYNRMSKLTSDSSSFVWIDGFGRLLAGDPRNDGDALVLSGGAYAEYYRVVQVDEDSAVVAAMISHDGSRSLRIMGLSRDASGAFSEVRNEEISDSALGLSSISCTDGVVSAVVRVKDEALGTSAFSVMTCDAPKARSVKAARSMGSEWMPGDDDENASFVLDTSGILGCDFKNFNVSFKPPTDTGIQPQGCCKWHRESSWGVSAGVEIPISADGSWSVPVNAGGGQTKKWSYYCQKAMGAGSSCAEEDKMLTARSEKGSIEVQGGIKYTFPLNTEYIVKHLKGIGYKIGRNIPINLNVDASGTLTGGKSHDIRERYVPRGDGSIAHFYTEDDDFTVRIQIQGNASANLGLAQFEGGGGRGRKKRDISVNTSGNEDLPLEASGEVHLEAHYNRHYRNGSLRSQSGGGSLGGEVRVLSLMGTLSGNWDPNKGFYGEWKYNFFNKSGEGNTLKRPQRRLYAAVQAIESSGEGLLMFPSEKVDDTLTLAAWGVYLDVANKKAIGCREYILDGNIRRGLFFAETDGGEERRISSDEHDVGWCSRLIEFDGISSVYYIACEPDFTGDPDDLMASYAHTRLYRLDCVDGVWGKPIAVVADGNWSQGGVSVSYQVDGSVMLAFKSSNILADVNGTGSEKLLVVLDDGNRSSGLKTSIVADVGGMAISSLVPYFVGESKRLLYSIANDGEDDEIREYAFSESSGAWEECECGEMHIRSMDTVPMKGIRRPLLGASSCGTCAKGCHCHCNDDDNNNPGDGCGCPIKCECKGLCSLGMCKCWDKRYNPDQPESKDPNEILGPLGVGEERYVKPGAWMDYTIYFENQTNATAAAQDVYVTLPKDAGLDWSTFKLGEVVFGDNIDTTLSESYDGESTYALPGTNWSVRTLVTHTTDNVVWHLRIVDPTTVDNYPDDPYAGFLPPNDETGRGEGHLRFSVCVKKDAVPGSVISASAVIEFDPLNGNAPIETDPAWWNTVYPGKVIFDKTSAKVEEGKVAVIKVIGGSADAASSVKLYLSYNTAAAADLDLAKGAIDGVTPKGGLKFPLQLSWEADDIVERVVTIPVKADKAVEDDEFFTLQLAAPVGMELGDTTICTVTIRDPGYDELAAKIASGTATKAEKSAWDKLQNAKAHYMRGLAEPADAGKVAGSGLCANGKKVTLKATANKGFVFMDWCDAAGYRVATNATLVVDRTAKPAASSATSTTLTGVNEDATYYAKFITVDEDRASVTLALGSEELDASTVLETNVTCGVALEWPLASYALSATTVKVAGLPAGLKFAAKDVVDPKTKQVTVKANTIYGAPTAASKVGKDGKPTPSDVKITVTTAGKSSVTYLVKLTVDPLPAWAVGTFDGEVEGGGIVQAFTVATSGKISGKVLEGGRTWTLSAGQFNHVEHVEQVGGSDVFYAAVVGKAGKEVVTNEVEVVGAVVKGVEVGVASSYGWSAWQNLWKRADTKSSMPVLKKSVVKTVELDAPGDVDNVLTLTFKANGVVSFAGKIAGSAVSGSSQLVFADDGNWHVTLYAPPKGSFPGWCATISVALVVDGQNVDIYVVDVDLDL